MKKLLITTLVISLFACTASFATLTRTLTMGDANNIVHDNANIWLYPSTLWDYPEMAVGEFSRYYYYYDLQDGEGSEFTDIGLHYKFGENKPFVMGLYFTINQPNPEFPYWLTYFDYYDIPSNDRIDLFYSRMLGDNKFGFHFNYIHGSRKEEIDSADYWGPDNTEESATEFAFDLGLTTMENKLDLSAGVAFLSWTDRGFNGNNRSKPDGNIIFNAMGRYFHEVDQKITFVPHGSFMLTKFANKEFENWEEDIGFDQVTERNDYKYMQLDAGLGMNYTPAAGILAIADAGLVYRKYNAERDDYDTLNDIWSTTEYTDTWFNLPYFRVGLDAVVFNWMDLRMGGTSYWTSYKSEDDFPAIASIPAYTNKYSRNYVYNETFLGAGFHWGNLIIDTYLDPGLLIEGLNFISGGDEDMNFQISLLYKMF